MASIFTSQKFNLIPPKTKEEILVIEERDNSTLYSFLLVFAAMVIFFILTLAQALVVDPRLNMINTNIENKEIEISTFDNVKKLNGELFVKSWALDPILDEDIKLTQLLEITQEIIADLPNANVLSYSRETDGQFVLNLQIEKYSDINSIVNNAENIEVLEDLFVENLSESSGSTYTAMISFHISNIQQQLNA